MINENILSTLTIKEDFHRFPSDVLKWMKKNAKPRSALKLMQICKYFQHEKFPYPHLKYVNWNYEDGLSFFVDGNHIFNGLMPKNMWFTGTLDLSDFSISFLMEKVVVCDIKKLRLSGQTMTYDEFKFLASSGTIIECSWFQVTLKYENDELVSFKDVLRYLPNIEDFSIHEKIPPWHFYEGKHPKFESLFMTWVPENFDLNAFSDFMIDNQHTSYYLEFYPWTSEDFTQTYLKFVEKVNKAWKPENEPPKIKFKRKNEK